MDWDKCPGIQGLMYTYTKDPCVEECLQVYECDTDNYWDGYQEQSECLERFTWSHMSVCPVCTRSSFDIRVKVIVQVILCTEANVMQKKNLGFFMMQVCYFVNTYGLKETNHLVYFFIILVLIRQT